MLLTLIGAHMHTAQIRGPRENTLQRKRHDSKGFLKTFLPMAIILMTDTLTITLKTIWQSLPTFLQGYDECHTQSAKAVALL